jgi:hypothetical protein
MENKLRTKNSTDLIYMNEREEKQKKKKKEKTKEYE